jgi:hypothetical protein
MTIRVADRAAAVEVHQEFTWTSVMAMPDRIS